MTTATEIAGRIRRGEVTSRAVTEDVLARIAGDDAVNAVVETRAEFALQAADAADAVDRGGARDRTAARHTDDDQERFNVAGMCTTWGNPAFAEYVADRDATVVERLSGPARSLSARAMSTPCSRISGRPRTRSMDGRTTRPT